MSFSCWQPKAEETEGEEVMGGEGVQRVGPEFKEVMGG